MDYSSTLNPDGWLHLVSFAISETSTTSYASNEELSSLHSDCYIKGVLSEEDVHELPCSLELPQVKIRINRLQFTCDSRRSSRKSEGHVFLRDNYFASGMTEKAISIQLFKSLADIAEGVVCCLNYGGYDVYDVITIIAAFNKVLFAVWESLLSQAYNKIYRKLFVSFEKDINILLGFIEEYISTEPADDVVASYFSSETTSMNVNREKVLEWIDATEFYSLKSTRFEGISHFGDFLPKEDPTQHCTACMDTALDDVSTLGILSHCSHLFCTACLQNWFKSNNTCPMCRRRCQWLSQEYYLYCKSQQSLEDEGEDGF